MAKLIPSLSSFLANNLTSCTTWMPHPTFKSGQYMFLMTPARAAASSRPASRSPKNLATVRRRRSDASNFVPMARRQAVKRQFPSASTSPPWERRNPDETSDPGSFQRTPLLRRRSRPRRCCSSRPVTAPHATSTAASGSWNVGSTAADVAGGGAAGTAAAESQRSFPIWRRPCQVGGGKEVLSRLVKKHTAGRVACGYWSVRVIRARRGRGVAGACVTVGRFDCSANGGTGQEAFLVSFFIFYFLCLFVLVWCSLASNYFTSVVNEKIIFSFIAFYLLQAFTCS